MEITGRITANATVHKVNKEKEVVNFSIAINDNYKPKGSNELKEVTTFINCSYWLNSKTAQILKKGAMVQLFGRIGINLYNNADGKACGSLTFHTNNIKILVFAKKIESSENIGSNLPLQKRNQDEPDDLPF